MIHLKRIKIKTRAQFVWIIGVLFWGTTTSTLTLLLHYLLSGETHSLGYIIMNYIVFSIGGYFGGVWIWKISQKRQKKHDLGKNKENL